MLISDLKRPGDDDIIDKLFNDFLNKSIEIQKEKIIEKIREFDNQARIKVINEK